MADSTKGGNTAADAYTVVSTAPPAPPRLRYVTVFDRRLGSTDESAGDAEVAEKILYFRHARAADDGGSDSGAGAGAGAAAADGNALTGDVDVLHQLRTVGFSEGMLDFTRSFGSKDAWVAIHMDHQRIGLLEVEPETFLVVSVDNPRVPSPADPKRGLAARARGSASSGSIVATDDVSDDVLETVLRAGYDVFCLFFQSIARVLGTPAAQAHHEALQALRKKVRKAEAVADSVEQGHMEDTAERRTVIESLPDLYDQLHDLEAASPARTVRVALASVLDPFLSTVDFSRPTVFQCMDGLLYHSVTRGTYLRVQHFVNSLTMAFPRIEQCALLFDGHVMWSSLPQDDLEVVYKFLRVHSVNILRRKSTSVYVKSLFPAPATPLPLQAAAQASGTPRGFQTAFGVGGKIGPENPVFAPGVFVNGSDGPFASHRMLWYQHGALTLLLFVTPSATSSAPLPSPTTAASRVAEGRAPDGRDPGRDSPGPRRAEADDHALYDTVATTINSHMEHLNRIISDARGGGAASSGGGSGGGGGGSSSGGGGSSGAGRSAEAARVIYFNAMNRAVKLSGVGGATAADHRKQLSTGFYSSDQLYDSMSRAFLQSMAAIVHAFRHVDNDSDVTEAVFSVRKGPIVVSRRTCGRELTVIHDSKDHTVSTAVAAVARLLDSQGFSNIFMA